MKKNDSLAIHGGKPVRDTYLPYGKQWINNDDIEAVIDVLKSNYITTGSTINRFEKSVSEYVGAKYSVAFSSGTAALHAACFAAGIETGDEVITTPMTFAATSNSVLYCGGKPVFVDIDPQTYLISPEQVANHINAKTKAIITVDYTGGPADYNEIMKLAKEHDLIVIDDAAHALGSTYKGEKIGAISDMTMFSFHPVKHITTGEGGVITTNNKAYYDKLILFRNHGITRDPRLLSLSHGPWYYEMQTLGYNYRMTDIQAALGLSQLNRLDAFLLKRKTIANEYTKAFQSIKSVRVPMNLGDRESSWHLYVLRLDLTKLRVDRGTIYLALTEENIGVNVHYIPVYYHPYYRKLGYQKGLCPNAEKLYETIITLPLFPSMSQRDVDDVISAVQKVLGYYEV
ncbi:UDP-4-amino-4,6-dideoxy-N-acetyl-beta-L-altrosamine transaminase [Ornithinibacillus scapharcae]|uniref:UDP-4-amino-4, 6-dideoxy-N-acetyl-beta-L-altrosamine transaminase n=1 Tax=Ornithinibacillus scapharcae TaxID=1147159 RepID=UPI000225AB30|nr:UDP-4-amino-4,6-dideoxy-N-acetyl-beta-L-altrosamine transaminase [Ornithinibacillus scapharcae]